ncbi:glycogen/starch/alpha-glucan phosphorylase [Anaerococcus rubeinfantis]|uniref:glycogen/starch/alpha-glucan phosphorylase n=1 Tax=Anaerococcus rubeinfantis TaxID=1720199 RepID=UPI00073E323B|nr:glycogen/starch/alpha-glucan phosphorylase [Anaerococcus rubeinfantis]
MNKNNNFILKRIQNFLYSFYAKEIEDARLGEIYDGLVKALMQDIGKNWSKSKKTFKNKEVYLLSFEYSPGKFIENSIESLDYKKEVNECLKLLNISMEDLLNYEKEASLGNSDIGIGSWYLMNELSKNKIKSMAYALRYESGGMKQVIKDGRQFINPNEWLSVGNKWEHKKAFSYILNIEGKKTKAVAYDMPIFNNENNFVNTLRLRKAESINKIDYLNLSSGDFKSAYDDYINNNSLTQFLYLDNSTYEGKLFRLKQEYFYSVSTIQDIFRRYFKKNHDIKDIKNKIKIILADIHPSLAIIEFIRALNQGYNLEINECIEISKKVFVHIGFLLTSDSKESYDLSMIKSIDSSLYDIILKLDDFVKENQNLSIIEYGQLKYDRINYCFVDSYYYLSKIFIDNYKEEGVKFSYLNFGVDRYLYSDSNNLLFKKSLENYGINITNKDSVRKLGNFKNYKAFYDEMEEVKFKNKLNLIKEFKLNEFDRVNPYSIFDMQLAMFHEAKRQLLNAISIASIYYKLKDNSNILISPTTYIFSGKANDGYFMAKEIIKFILALKHMIDKDKLIKEKLKIIFIEDANVERLRKIYPACDIYSNLSLPIFDNQSFHMLNSIFNLSNVLSSKGGIISNIDKENEIYTFGQAYEEIEKIKNENTYDAREFYYKNDIIKRTIDNLINEDYSNLPYNFKNIYDYLISYNDSFFIFKDHDSLLDMRFEISKDYLDKKKWIDKEIDNILWANEFNLDKNLEKFK